MVLLGFSIVFYAWGGPRFLGLLLFMTWVSWYCAKKMDAAKSPKGKKNWLLADVITMLAMLFVFKYATFFGETFQSVFHVPKVVPQIILPIGISFYTFQLLSYNVDVYRGEVRAQEKYWKLLLYAGLFHQCIAGPIVRYEWVAEDIDQRSVTMSQVYEGVRRFSIGLAKKAVLANGCASVADELLPTSFEAVANTAPAALWMGMLFYMLEIYLDFSAYSDMAIGMGRMVGFRYPENFRYPYIASSVQEFWRRWHISLSTFFRDYVYIPLGGSRKGLKRTVINTFVVWFLTGMWHGASWNYMLWGLYFFVFLMLERFGLKKWLDKGKVLPHIYAILVIYFGWVLFKFEDFSTMRAVLVHMFQFGAGFTSLETSTLFMNQIFFLIFCMIACTPLSTWLWKKLVDKGMDKKWGYVTDFVDVVLPAVLLVLSVMALTGDSYNPFLYFQF